MELISYIVLTLGALFSGFSGVPETPSAVLASASVELGIQEVSPRGEAGGFAIPASGCSDADPDWHGFPIHDCSVLPEINTNKPVIRYGEDVIITWDPHSHINCVLSGNVTDLPPVGADGNFPGTRTDTPTGETTYTITCDGVGNADAATVKVLPRIQET